MNKKIRIDDLRINRVLKEKLTQELGALLKEYRGIYDLYQYKSKVEKQFSQYITRKFTSFVDSGTTALQLSLFLLGINKGDEVIVPIVTNASTAAVVMCLEANPVFVDIKENFTIDEEKMEQEVTKKTKVIIPVHMFGHACNMKKIEEIAKKYNLKIVEDVCQAHGSTYKNKKLGCFGDIATFSFDPHKNLSSLGAGGALVFDNESFTQKIKNSINVELGEPELIDGKRFPARMSYSDIATLKVKLNYSKLIEQNKIKNKKEYEKHLSDVKQLKIFIDDPDQESVRQFYAIWAEKRDELSDYLKSMEIYCKLPYTPLNRLKIFKRFDKNNYPVADKYMENVLYLPIFSFMKTEEVKLVCEEIKSFYSKK